MTTESPSSEEMGQLVIQTVDVKLEQNSKGYNVAVHLYEFATKERINQVIENAVYAMKKTHERIAEELQNPN